MKYYDKELLLRNRIKTFRKKKGWSQTELAKRSKTTQNTISSFETGQYQPTAYLAGLMCKALECEFEDLFYFVTIDEDTGKETEISDVQLKEYMEKGERENERISDSYRGSN